MQAHGHSQYLMSPALGEEINKDPGCACVCVAQGSQGLAQTRLPAPRQGLLTYRAPECGLHGTGINYKGRFKYSLYFSLPLFFFFSKTVIF